MYQFHQEKAFCTLTPSKRKARREALKLTYSDASTTNTGGDCKMSCSQFQVQPGHFCPSSLFSCTISAVQPAPTSQALGHTQEHKESCPQLANLEAKHMAESNQLRTTADGERAQGQKNASSCLNWFYYPHKRSLYIFFTA